MNNASVECKCLTCKQWFKADDFKLLKQTQTKIWEHMSDECYSLDVLCPNCSKE